MAQNNYKDWTKKDFIKEIERLKKRKAKKITQASTSIISLGVGLLHPRGGMKISVRNLNRYFSQ